MDFVSSLPKTSCGHDVVWVIVDRLTKSAHFILVNMKYKMEKLVELYIKEVVSFQYRIRQGPEVYLAIVDKST